jgi:hypothetical protein
MEREDKRWYSPQLTREACQELYHLALAWGLPMTVTIREIIHLCSEAEKEQREERLIETGFAPTVWIRRPGEEWEPVLPEVGITDSH